MVRLGDTEVMVLDGFNGFQFHYGSIGRIKIRRNKPCKISISIPLWFDWEIIHDALDGSDS